MKVAIALYTAFLLFFSKSTRRDQAIFLSLFFIIYGFLGINELFLNLSGYLSAPHLLGLTYPINLLLAPIFYFYARALTAERSRWVEIHDWPASVGLIVAIVVATPFYILSGNEKVALMSAETRDPELYQMALWGCRIGLLLFLAVSLAYLRLAFMLLKRHTARILDLFSYIDDKAMNWLRWSIFLLIVGWGSYTASEMLALSGLRSLLMYQTYNVFELGWIMVIAFFGLRQKAVYSESIQSKGGQAKSTYADSTIDQAQLTKIASDLDSVMHTQSLYLLPELSLSSLSSSSGIRENLISETLSRHFNSNFYDYINSYRIKHACQFLENSDRTILNILLDSGFSSRSTFYSAFSKHIGMTPSQFRKQASQFDLST